MVPPPRELRLTRCDRPRVVGEAVRTHSWNERSAAQRLRIAAGNVRGPADAWRVAAWVARGSANRSARWLRRQEAALALRRRRAALAERRRAGYALGAELAVLGPVAEAVFAASRRVSATALGRRVDVAVADTPAHAAGLDVPSAVLSEAPGDLSVPAFDPLACNPVEWTRHARSTVAALGPLGLLPPGSEADRVVSAGDRRRLRLMHHLEDTADFHPDALTRAGVLVRLAALGVVVHLADDDPRLAALLGAELHTLMTGDVRGIGPAQRERVSIRMRRVALREHSLRGRARQVCALALADPPRPPRVSILLATRRPERLRDALAAVARQTYPRLELVLALHGEGFSGARRRVGAMACAARIVRVGAAEPLGSVLNTAADAASGTLLTKMDDDDLYGADHVWDLVLAHEYSQAKLVGKELEYVYLAASDRTLHRLAGGGESYTGRIAGGALLIAREDLRHLGGWRQVPRAVDDALCEDVAAAGGRIYRTHSSGFMYVRHSRRQTWNVSDDYFLAQADRVSPGWDPAMADLGDPGLPHPAHNQPSRRA